jgi:tetratricopeptide (TPR) repeat protein
LDHPSIETLAKLLAGDLSHEELLTGVLPHFFEQCPECQRRHQEILRLQREFGHWDERVAVMEGLQAPELFARFKDRPFDEQLSLVADDETFHAWGFCQLLLKESLEAGFEDAARAINFAELAVKISQDLGDAYDPNWVLDLRARAHAYLGNAQRVLGELRSAEAAFREAESLLARSMTGNSLIEAEVLHLKASLLCSQRYSKKALELVDRALKIYREAEEPHGIGVALMKKGKILEESGDLEGAIRLLQDAFEEIDPEAEPRLALVARYNLLLCLSLAGRHEEAGEMLEKVRGFFLGHARPLDLLRLQWTEGKIALGLGHAQEAEEAFRRVQEEFLARGMGYDAALVSLDLAILYARDRRTEDLKRLAVEILQVFESRDVHREAVAALILFRSACEEERLTVELAGQIATLLQRERRSK